MAMDTHERVLEGEFEFRGTLFSPDWELSAGARTAARIRSENAHSTARLDDGTVWQIIDDGVGMIRAVEAGVPFARATRDRPQPNHWQITGPGIYYQMQPVGLVGRRWNLSGESGPAGVVRNSMTAPNLVTLSTEHPLPIVVVILAWAACRSHPGRTPSGVLPDLKPRDKPATDTAIG